MGRHPACPGPEPGGPSHFLRASRTLSGTWAFSHVLILLWSWAGGGGGDPCTGGSLHENGRRVQGADSGARYAHSPAANLQHQQ